MGISQPVSPVSISVSNNYQIISGPVYNPYRSEAILTPYAGNIGTRNVSDSTSWTTMIQIPPIPTSTSWTGIEIDMAGITSSPVKPEVVSVALCNGGDQITPTLDGGDVTWVTASSLSACPSGTDTSPGLGKVCETLNIPSQAGAKMLVVRIQLPAGDYAAAGVNGGGVGTNSNAYPVGVSIPKTQGNISANPGTASGWGEAFGVTPWFAVRYVGLSTPVLSLLAVGDSHLQGYDSNGSNGNRGPFGALEASSLWSTRPNINIINMGRMGHTTSQISSRMAAILSQWNVGGVLRQRASINDHDVSFDVIQTQADTSWTILQNDGYSVSNLGLLFIPFSPAGANGWASGWFSRFTSHVSDETTLYGANGTGVVYEESSILNQDGSYQTGYVTGDNAHPTLAAQAIWGDAMWPTLNSVLTAKGFTV